VKNGKIHVFPFLLAGTIALRNVSIWTLYCSNRGPTYDVFPSSGRPKRGTECIPYQITGHNSTVIETVKKNDVTLLMTNEKSNAAKPIIGAPIKRNPEPRRTRTPWKRTCNRTSKELRGRKWDSKRNSYSSPERRTNVAATRYSRCRKKPGTYLWGKKCYTLNSAVAGCWVTSKRPDIKNITAIITSLSTIR
jgi:hypothetical protein